MKLNVTATLAVIAVLDLFLFRIISPLFGPLQGEPSFWIQAVDVIGRYAHNLGGTLGLVLVAAGVYNGTRRPVIFPVQGRRALWVLSGTFIVLSVLPVLKISMAPRFQGHLIISTGLLALLLLVSSIQLPFKHLTRLMLCGLVLPSLMPTVALFAHRWSGTVFNAGNLLRFAEIARLSTMALAPGWIYWQLRQPHQPPGRTSANTWSHGTGVTGHTNTGLTSGRNGSWVAPAALISGLFAAGLMGTLLLTNYTLVNLAFRYGLRIELPLSSTAEGLLYASALTLAVGGCVSGCTLLFGTGRPVSLAAWGLLLVGCAGFQPADVQQRLFTITGLLAVLNGITRRQSVARPRTLTRTMTSKAVQPPGAELCRPVARVL